MTLAETSSRIHQRPAAVWFRSAVVGWFNRSARRPADSFDREPPLTFPEIIVVAQGFPGDPSAAMIAELWMLEDGRRRSAHASALP